MEIPNIQKIIVIVGPTASGKSDWGVRLAKKINGEIISADSRQVYRGLNIGSGKITKKEMQGISHYCLDIASPRRVFSAEDFKQYGNRALQQILKKNKIPIIVGGTGFYIDVLLGRVQTANVPPNLKLREKLKNKSTQQLFLMLKKPDQEYAKIVDKKNPRRLIRAIEIVIQQLSHQTLLLSSLEPDVGSVKILWLGVEKPPTELKKRIHRRLLKRLREIIKEVKVLHKKGLSWKRMNDLGLEYRYATLYLQNKLTKDEFTKQLETAIWHYARRQMTWFRKNKEIKWIKSKKEAQKLIKQFLRK